MKIAIPIENGEIFTQFGSATTFNIFDTEGVTDTIHFPEAGGCGCHSGIIPLLASKGVEIVLAGSLGGGAHRMLTQYGIKAVRGCTGNAQTVLKSFLSGELTDKAQSCESHKDATQKCDHHS